MEIIQRVVFSNIWRLGVDLSGDEEHHYRYCVVVILNTEAQTCQSQHSIMNSEANGRQKKVIVRRWETHLIPRYVKIHFIDKDYSIDFMHSNILYIQIFMLSNQKLILSFRDTGKSHPRGTQMMEL